MKNLLIAILFLISQISVSQGIKVIDVKEGVSGSDAFYAPVNNDGHPCGLVKIQSMISDLTFGGIIEGHFTYENNEYKVFLAKGSKQLIIKRPHVMPVVVNFPDYGIGEISSKATYIIKLKEVSLNAIKNLLIIDVKPRIAKVYIDDLLIDNENGDGGYRLLLPKGDHICKIESKGYRTNASIIKIGKGTQTINVELESLLADIEINCKTSGARILIDGEDVGVGSWKGKLPAGMYKVDVQLDGYIPHSQSIALEEKGALTLSVPALKRAKGLAIVKTNVTDAIVLLDGSLWGNTRRAKEIQTGSHKLIVKAPYGYKEFEKDILIKTGSSDTINVVLQPINDNYAKAFAGDMKAQCLICSQKMESSKYKDKDSIERNYWFERIFDNFDKIDKQSFDLVCPYVSNGAGCDFSQAGMYTYFRNNPEKGLKILYKWNKMNPEDDSVVLEITGLCDKIKDYDSVIKWGTIGLDICGYEGYMGWFISYLAEACIKMGNVNKAITIFKSHIKDWFGWQYGYKYIGDVYKDMGDRKNAIVYYERFLKESSNVSSYDKDVVRKQIRECR